MASGTGLLSSAAWKARSYAARAPWPSRPPATG